MTVLDFHRNDKRDPLDMLCAIVAGEMEEPPQFTHPRPLTDLERRHYEMQAAISRTAPPRIGRTECLDADQLEELAEHMQAIGNCFAAYAREVISEFAQNSGLDRKEAEAAMHDAFGDFIGPMFNAVEDVIGGSYERDG
jgi:hypothetical protein